LGAEDGGADEYGERDGCRVTNQHGYLLPAR
jgi:hypothetical protein